MLKHHSHPDSTSCEPHTYDHGDCCHHDHHHVRHVHNGSDSAENMHHHAHHHHHEHLPVSERLTRAFRLGIVLNIVYVVAEFVSGVIFDSMSLISDAGHNLSDVISLVLALLAFRLVRKKPSDKFTYGFKKSTVLVSLLNACLLLVAVGVILWESILKIRNPQPVEGNMIAWVAGIGIIINAFTAWLFMRDRNSDLNIKGAFLHMAADALVSLGVVVSGIIIGFTGWYIIDPLIGIVIAVVILISTTQLLLDSIRLSLDGVPNLSLAPANIRSAVMKNVKCVKDLHHIHIWAISTTEYALTAHVVIADAADEGTAKIAVKKCLADLSISHSTLEFEYPGVECCNDSQCCR